MNGKQGGKNLSKLDATVDIIAGEIRKLEEDSAKLATALKDSKPSLDFHSISANNKRRIGT